MTCTHKAEHIADNVHVIRFDELTREFVVGNSERVSIKQLGAMLAQALITGRSQIMLICRHSGLCSTVSYRVDVSVSYINQMLAFVAEHGWFWDELPDNNHRRASDHAFDPDQITPGLFWAQAQRLLSAAQELESFAAKHSHMLHSNDDDARYGLGQDLRTTHYLERSIAGALLKACLPDYRVIARKRRRLSKRKLRVSGLG